KKRNGRERVEIAPRQLRLLEVISRTLGVAIAEAVEYALAPQIFLFGCVAIFFASQIEASPGSRLTRKDLWAAYLAWHTSRSVPRKMSEDSFAAMAHAICDSKKIAVRVRNNQVVCLDVRLRQAADCGEKTA